MTLSIVRENVCNKAKKLKRHVFFGFRKKRENGIYVKFHRLLNQLLSRKYKYRVLDY